VYDSFGACPFLHVPPLVSLLMSASSPHGRGGEEDKGTPGRQA